LVVLVGDKGAANRYPIHRMKILSRCARASVQALKPVKTLRWLGPSQPGTAGADARWKAVRHASSRVSELFCAGAMASMHESMA